MTSPDEIKSSQLTSLKDYIVKLYLIGGIPLVLIGLGAANLFISGYGDSETKQIIITVMFFVLGAFTWYISANIAIRRWATEMEIISKQDEIVINAICEISRTETSDVVKSKIDGLRSSLEDLGVRQLASHDRGNTVNDTSTK